MTKRLYGQYCPLARVLDVLGERWTLLIVRELLFGPRRYSDLLSNLPGVGTTLLADRLKHLEQTGIVRRSQLPRPAASAVYELTQAGQELGRALVPLVLWGAKHVLGERLAGEEFPLNSFFLLLESSFNTERAMGVHDLYEFHIDEDVFHVRVDDGKIFPRQGPAPEKPDLIVRSDVETFMAVGMGTMDPFDSAASGRATVEGDPETLRRCLDIMRPTIFTEALAPSG